MQQQPRPTPDRLVDEPVTALPDDAIVSDEPHGNAPAVIIRADRPQDAPRTELRVRGRGYGTGRDGIGAEDAERSNSPE